MVEPTGVPATIEVNNPNVAHTTENIAENIITDLKHLKILIADKAGKIISADIKREPTKFIASTIITAIVTAIKKLYAPTLIPVAFEKSSSNVTAKIL